MFKTRLFEWAEEEHIAFADLAKMLDYSERQLYRHRRSHLGQGYVSRVLRDRAVTMLGEYARRLFVPYVPGAPDGPAATPGTEAATRSTAAPDAREPRHEGKDTPATRKPRGTRPAASTKERAA